MKFGIKKFTLNVVSLSILPVLILGVIVIFMTSSLIYTSLKDEVGNSLKDLVFISYQNYENKYPGDFYYDGEHLYKGDNKIDDDFEFIDNIKEHTGVDVTLFYQDKRVLTTISNDDGKRAVGTEAIKEVQQVVLNEGEDYFSDSVLVNDMSYFGYYMPLKNSSGDIVGMLFAGRSRNDVMENIMHNIYLVSGSIIIIMAITITISCLYSKKTIFALNATKRFLGEVANGDLTKEIEPYVLQRQDEIGDMGRFAVMLKKSIGDLVGKDPLTGLHNRRSCDVVLNSLFERAYQKDIPFALVMGDIDFFKRVNDTYGHQAGDKALKKIAEIISVHMEHLGFVFRWGGEEFVLIYEDMDRFQAYEHLKELQEIIATENILWKDDQLRLTMTFGLIDSNENNDLDCLINMVDSFLYQGKNEGRNRIIFNRNK